MKDLSGKWGSILTLAVVILNVAFVMYMSLSEGSSSLALLLGLIPTNDKVPAEMTTNCSVPAKQMIPEKDSAQVPWYLEGLGYDMGRNFTIPKTLRNRAVAYRGDLIRMKQFLRKVVVERKRFKVLAVGSSVTAEFAGRRGDQGVLVNSWLSKNIVRQPDGWLSNALDWLSETFPPREDEDRGGSGRSAKYNRSGNSTASSDNAAGPDEKPLEAGYMLRNNGFCGAAPSAYLGCEGRVLMEDMPRDVDLIVMEFAVTTRFLSGVYDMDALLQYYYRYFIGSPAVLIVNFFEFCTKGPDLYCVNDARRAADDLFPKDNRTWELMAGTFTDFLSTVFQKENHVTEESITGIARYYGLPVISIRDAMFHVLAGQVPGYSTDALVKDGTHPSELGKTYSFPDLLISFFQDVIRELQDPEPTTDLEKATAEYLLSIPPPLMFNPDLPPSDFEVVEKDCYRLDDLVNGHMPKKISLSGWNWTDDVDTNKTKAGLIARKAGSVADIEIDTSTSEVAEHFSSEEASKKAQATVDIQFLQSYERMGDILVECAGGCSCGSQLLNGTRDAHVSLPKMESINVTQSVNCHLRMTCQKGLYGEKCKVLMVELRFKAHVAKAQTQ